jgi:hypothetical protein
VCACADGNDRPINTAAMPNPPGLKRFDRCDDLESLLESRGKLAFDCSAFVTGILNFRRFYFDGFLKDLCLFVRRFSVRINRSALRCDRLKIRRALVD